MIQLSRLRAIRMARFLSQRDLAAKSGVAESTIARLEQGLQLSRFVTVRKLAEALGVAPEELTKPEETREGKGAA